MKLDSSDSSQSSSQGSSSPFPRTLWAIVSEAQAGDSAVAAEAMGKLCAMYREPVFVWLQRRGYEQHNAQDLAQGFMEHLLEANRLETFQKRETKFRSFLIECLKRFLRDVWRKGQAQKRGGAVEHFDIDEMSVGAMPDMDRELDLQFAVAVHAQALTALAQDKYAVEPKRTRFQTLCQFIWGDDGPSYAEIGAVLGMTANHVKKAVFDLRQHYFEAFRLQAAQTVAPAVLDEETRYLLTLLAENRDSWSTTAKPPPSP